MKVKEVPFSWIPRSGHRLDVEPFVGGAVEARLVLESLKGEAQPLHAVTAGGMSGIVHAGRIKRQWVEVPRYGTRFLSSTDILRADLTHCSLISNKAVRSNPLLIIRKGWTLITRAGTVGRMAYSRPDMDGMACTEDVLRIVPDSAVILSGYLFAFLNSRYGIPMVTSGTYGAIIQHIEPEHVADLPVPRLGQEIEEEAHVLVERAAINRSKAAELRSQALQELRASLDLPDMTGQGTPLTFSTFGTTAHALGRLDAAYHSPPGAVAVAALERHPQTKLFAQVAQVFQTNIFKRPYVSDPQYGYPYFSGAELFTYDPPPRGYLRKRAPGIDQYVVRRDWLLMQDAGQLGGLIGRVMRVTASQDGGVVSNHLIRIVPETRADAGYLFALLSSSVGYRAVVRNAFGSSIPQLESAHLGQIRIPWPEDNLRERIADPILASWDLEDDASERDRQAVALVERAIKEAA